MIAEMMMNVAEEEQIHSGQFMVSHIHDDDNTGKEESSGIDIMTKMRDLRSCDGFNGFNFDKALTETQKEYNFESAINIDSSLTKLFQCMTIAYKNKLISPKWNNFKGLKLALKDKIRLNNIIWREWNMQFKKNKKPVICQFDPPISDRTHSKPEAVVLEGKYWKRRMDVVTAEYKKWRVFNSARFRKRHTLESASSRASLYSVMSPASTLDTPNKTASCYNNFNDALFSTLNQNAFDFPNPKELVTPGINADFLQPGLLQLQPNLDEFMDTLDVSDFFASQKLSSMERPDPMFPSPSKRLSSVPEEQLACSTTDDSSTLNNVVTLQPAALSTESKTPQWQIVNLVLDPTSGQSPAPPLLVPANAISVIPNPVSLHNNQTGRTIFPQIPDLLPVVDLSLSQTSPKVSNTQVPRQAATSAFASATTAPLDAEVFRVPQDCDLRPHHVMKDSKRSVHINAEHKRRCNINSGFDTLNSMVPHLVSSCNSKISKAATLRRAFEYIEQLKKARKQARDEADVLKRDVEQVQQDLINCQSQLPATGAPLNPARADRLRDQFDAYVKQRTLNNWKFWLFSGFIRTLFDDYNQSVRRENWDEFYRSLLGWLDQNCSLLRLRPAVLNSLRTLSLSTSVLTDPSKLPTQCTEAVTGVRARRHSAPEGRAFQKYS